MSDYHISHAEDRLHDRYPSLNLTLKDWRYMVETIIECVATNTEGPAQLMHRGVTKFNKTTESWIVWVRGHKLIVAYSPDDAKIMTVLPLPSILNK